MKRIHIPSYISLCLSFALLASTLPLAAMSQDILLTLSESDQNIIAHHTEDMYVYLGKEVSNIAELVSHVYLLDNDIHSPLSSLKNHIDTGYMVAEHHAVIESLAYMHNVLRKHYNKLDVFQAKKMASDINILINQIENGSLTIDSYTLELAKTNNDQQLPSAKRSHINTMQVKGLLSVNDQLVQNITAVDLSVTDTIIQNATITNLSATDQFIQNINVTNLSVADETVTGTLSANDEVLNAYLRFQDVSGGEYVGLQSPAVVPTSYTLSLPSAIPTSNQIVRANSTTPTNLEWATAGIFNTPTASKTVYVTKYGNDTTGDGSFATPYLTLTKAIQTANSIASAVNPIAINISSGIYTEDNSSGPLLITAAGISIVGASSSSVIFQPNTPANDLLLINNTIRVADVTFRSTSPLAIGVNLTAGNLSVFNNVRFANFLIGVNCTGGLSNSYGFNLCLFLTNSTAINIDDTTVECDSCTISGATSIAGPAANTGVIATGANTRFVTDGGVCGLCSTGFHITDDAIATISNISFRRNAFDIVQDGSSHLTLSTCTFELTNDSSDIDIQVSGAGTIAEIIGCEFSGTDTLGADQGTSVIVSDDGLVNISGGVMHNYTTGLQVGTSLDTSSTTANISGLIIRDCTTNILQEGTSTLMFNASTASSSKISINDPTNVLLSFFDLENDGALTIGSMANQNTTLLQVATDPINHPGFNYKSSLYSTEAIGFENDFDNSSLYVLSSDNADVTSITTDRTKTTGLRLVSDTGSPVGGTTALRGWDLNKNSSTAELSFKYQNSDTIGQSSIGQYTVMQLDGVNNQLQLPTAATQIVFATDTNLYRSSANVLKTDDNFIVGTLTPDRVIVTAPVTNQLASSAVTGTELSYLSGVTSAIQTQLNGKVAKAGDTMTGTLQLPAGTTAVPSLTFTGSTTTGLSAATANSLSFSTNALERMKISSGGVISVDAFTTAGVVHNDSSGNLSSSLIVDGDITDATISNAKLATISSANTSGNIVVRDGSGNFQANMITLFGPVVNNTDAATKAYVDTAISTGLVAKTPALVGSTTNVTISGLQTIDGVLLSANDRVLLVGQTNPIQNGLWLAQVGAWTRPLDFANGTTAGQAYVLITSGDTNEGSSYLCNTPTAVIGTDPLGFSLFSLPDTTTGANVGAGTGLVFKNKTGVTLNFRSLLAGTHVTITNNTDDITFTTDATDANTASTIVARDASGNFSAGTITASLTGAASLNVLKAGDTMTGALQLPAGTAAAPSLRFTGSTTTGLSAATANTLSFDISGTEQMNITSSGVTVDGFTTAGVVHNSAAGLLSSSLIVNADVDPAAAIVDTKLATISTAGKVANSATTATSANTANAIVARDSSGNFVAGTITASLTGAASLNVLKAGDTMTGTLQLPAGTTALPSLVFTGSTTTGLSADADDLSFTTSGVERMKIDSAGVVSIDEFITAGVVHNDTSGNLSTSLIVNADVSPTAAIVDTKLAMINTVGKVANSATTATSNNVPSTIVQRDSLGNFSAGSVSFTDAVIDNLTISGCIASGCITDLSVVDASISGTLSVTDEIVNGDLTLASFTTAGVIHNDTSGLLSSSLIVNADVAAGAAIVDTKLATISTAGKVANSATTATNANTASAIVARDASGNFSAGTITANLNGNATTATTATNFSGSLLGDVTGTQSATVVSLVGGQTAANVAAATVLANAATNLNTANAIVKRDGTGSFAAQVISMTDGVQSGNLILSTDPSTSTAGNIIKGSNSFIHNFGTDNTFMGISSGNFTMSGNGGNSAFGVNTLTANTTGQFNSAMGASSLAANTIGANNTALGYNTLLTTIIGNDNTAIGYQALANNLSDNNTAIGSNALTANTTGTDNIALGHNALASNITGASNIAIGSESGQTITTGSGNIYINADAASTSESSTIRIGTLQTNCFIAGISGVGVSGDGIVVDSNGQLGITLSSRKFKHNIENIGSISEDIFKLRPISFIYNSDTTNTLQFGLIAEEVDAIFPDIVSRDNNNVPYTVRYHVLPILLLNELQKQHKIIEDIKREYVTREEMNKIINSLEQLLSHNLSHIAS